MKNLFSLFILTLTSLCCFSQKGIVIKGQCSDSSSKAPILGATIIIISNDQVLGYQITDKNGFFSIIIENENVKEITLTCRHISYVEKSFTIAKLKVSDFYKIELVQSSKTLSEITIKSEKWEKNDTTNFYIDSSTNLKAKKVEDLLKTLPGFEMKDNGQIKYNDKIISTLLVNGENLTGSNYGVVTKNLDADVLKQVQVIDNFSENRIIGSIFKTGDVAVNLLTKDEINGKINGSAKLSSSFFKKFDNDLNLIGIKKRKQIFIAGNFNNTGEDKNPEFNSSDKGTFYTTNSTETNYYFTTPILTLTAESLPNNYKLDEKNSYFFPSISFPINNKFKIISRANFKVENSNLANLVYSKTQVSDSFSFISNSQSFSKSKLSEITAAFILKFDNQKNSALNFEYKTSYKHLKVELSNIQTGDFSDSMKVNSKIPVFSQSVFISGAHKLSSKTAVGIGINAIFNSDDGEVNFNTRRFAAFYNLSDNYNFLRQSEQQNSNVVISDLFFIKKLSDGSRNIKISNIYYNNKLSAQINLDSLFKTISVFEGKRSVKFNKTFIELSENRTARKTPLSFNAAIGNYFIADLKKDYLFYIATFNISRKITKRFTITGSVFSGKNLPSSAIETKDSLVTGISSVQIAANEYKPIKISKLFISLHRNAWISSSVSYSINWQPKNYNAKVFFDPRITVYGYQLGGSVLTQKSILKFKSYSMKAKGNFLLSLPVEEQRSDAEVNEKEVKLIVRSFSPSIKYVSNFKGKYNFEINYNHTFNSFVQKGNDEINAFSNFLMISQAQRIDISQNFIIGSYFSFREYKTGTFSQLDLYSIWQVNKKIRFDLKGINLLNQLSYKSEYVDANNIFRFENFASKPYLLLGISYDF